jgi:hypothetical protein
MDELVMSCLCACLVHTFHGLHPEFIRLRVHSDKQGFVLMHAASVMQQVQM